MFGACPKLVSHCKVLCPCVLWHVVRKCLVCHFLGCMIQSICLYLAHSMISVRAEVCCVPNSPELPTCYLFQSPTLKNFCISLNIGTIMYSQTNDIIFSWEYIFLGSGTILLLKQYCLYIILILFGLHMHMWVYSNM